MTGMMDLKYSCNTFFTGLSIVVKLSQVVAGMCRGWLGGWALPQEKSYFALALPHDWWLFAADLALVWDIDMCQYRCQLRLFSLASVSVCFRYFAQLVEKHLKPESQVIIMTHEPIWMEDWLTCSPDSTAPNLRDLIREHLKGRARIYIAGTLNNPILFMISPQRRPSFLHETQSVRDTCRRCRAGKRLPDIP